jgi:hypothetical protein
MRFGGSSKVGESGGCHRRARGAADLGVGAREQGAEGVSNPAGLFLLRAALGFVALVRMNSTVDGGLHR